MRRPVRPSTPTSVCRPRRAGRSSASSRHPRSLPLTGGRSTDTPDLPAHGPRHARQDRQERPRADRPAHAATPRGRLHSRCRRPGHRVHRLRGGRLMAAPLPPGRVVGRAGFGLAVGDVSWAANDQVAAVGAAGEERTAIELGRIAARPGGPTVLHDLAIPIPGFTANIDHALVFGHRVVLIDTKKWKPGFYWTVAGRTRRGLEAVPHADRKTMVMARE